MHIDWSDLVLRLIRAVGAFTSALAGIAALLTDGAFTKRDPPIVGRWKDFPLAKYRVTRWGGTLLVVIIFAPAVQFIGDWMKDFNDAKSQSETAKTIRSDIDGTVTASTDKSRAEILKTVNAVISDQKKLSLQTSDIAHGASDILTSVNRTLYPFKNVLWAYEVRLNLNHPKIRSFRDFMHEKAEEILAGRKAPLEDGYMTGTDDKATTLYKPYDGPARLLVEIDSPKLNPTDPAFRAILGNWIIFDIFKTAPGLNSLLSIHFNSPSYYNWLAPPYGFDNYGKNRESGKGFGEESKRIFQLIYIPGRKDDPKSDQCFVDYYWYELASFSSGMPSTNSDIAGLPDLVNSWFVLRALTDPENKYWGNEAPYTLELLRMRVGEQELSLTAQDLGKPVLKNGLLIYRVSMPKDFQAVLRRFHTVRSDLDLKLRR